MTDSEIGEGPEPASPAPAPLDQARLDPPPVDPIPREPWVSSPELRIAGWLILGLVAVGAVLGLAWVRWSRTPTRGLVYTTHAIIPAQTEGFISSDARFVILTGVAGLCAGLLAWRWRAVRGPVVVSALAIGGVLGALATGLVGALLGGGKSTGSVNTVLARLPLRVHAIGCLFIEAALATAVYLVCVLFVTPDDLDRRLDHGVPEQPDGSLVGARVDSQHSR